MRQWLGNIALALAALAATFAVIELVLFGMFLKPDDAIANVTINGVVRYEPGRVAIFRHPDGRQSRVTVNADGWNSTKAHYRLQRTPGRLRIAVIGDSYVHASYVDADKAFPEVIERTLRARGIDAEVLRFGMDGAPLSQYLHMLRREVVAYKPDVVLVQLIHNDFDESFRFLKTRYASSFLKIAPQTDGNMREIAPVDFEPTIADVLRSSATFRYLYYETNLYLTFKSLVSRYFWGGDEDYDPQFIVSGVDTRKLDDPEAMRNVTRYLINEMQSLAQREGFKLGLSIDAVRETIYGRRDAETQKVTALNVMAADAAESASVPLLDLTEKFASDYASRRERFEYPYDWHWNERANVLVGETLAQWLLDDPRLLGPKGSAANMPLDTATSKHPG